LKILVLLFILLKITQANTPSMDKQLKSNTDALKKIQQEIKKAEEKKKELESRESGVLNTIAQIDNGLTQTRDYLNDLQKKENLLRQVIDSLEIEIEVLRKNIEEQKKAIAIRIKNLYVHGKREEWELFYNLLKEDENPERKLYWVQRLLESDKTTIENYLTTINKEREEKQQLEIMQKEMAILHENKTKEEKKLQNQLIFQNEVLTKVQTDKSTQERAIEEYKRNQQALAALIASIEKKQQEAIAKKKAEEERKAKERQAQAQKSNQKDSPKNNIAIPQEVQAPVAVGPKCTPLNGQIISDYGHHVNKVLNIKTMHLGTEIRGQKGESVRAAAAGTVVMIGNVPGHGPSVILSHRGSHYSVYGHLATIKVKEGETVKNCQEIGTVGNAESTNGYKLFFQVYKGTQTQDPMAWLKN
jgi:septal ring factor EnvC (AmiA/AmiB activator)